MNKIQRLPKQDHKLKKKLSFTKIIFQIKQEYLNKNENIKQKKDKQNPNLSKKQKMRNLFEFDNPERMYPKKKKQKRKNGNKPWKKHRDQADEFELNLGQPERFGRKKRRRKRR